MKALVLGGTGFLGGWLVRELLAEPFNSVTVFGRNIAHQPRLAPGTEGRYSFVQGNFEEQADFPSLLSGCDTVFHLISTTVPGLTDAEPGIDFVQNVLPTIRLLEACKGAGISKIVFFSSGGTVYGGQRSNAPISEDAPTDPISFYGIQKLTIEKLIQMYGYKYALPYLIIRLSNPYGPMQNPNGRQGAVAAFTYRIINNVPITIYGDGEVVRDYIDVRDAIYMVKKLTESPVAHGVYNVGSGVGVSLNTLVSTIEKCSGLTAAVTHTPARADDVPVNVLSIDRYIRDISPLRLRPLEEGLHELIKYYREEA